MPDKKSNKLKNFIDICKTNILHKILSKNMPVWIFGAGPFGRDLCEILKQENFDVHGFIETKPKQSFVSGLTVISWDSLTTDQKKGQLAIGIYNRSTPLIGLKDIAFAAGFLDIYMPWDLYSQFENQLGWRYWLSASSFYSKNIEFIERTYNLLEDEISKDTLLNICEFRMGLNNDYANFNHKDSQYFNDLTLKFFDGEKVDYVDGGAYNGDTFLELANLREIRSAYLFEPDPDNYKKLTQSLADFPNSAQCIPLALSDQYQMLSFSAGNGEGGAITEFGTVHIAAVGLDQILGNVGINFIKFDVEGGEIKAINGSRNIIKKSKPILAISLYHKPQDLWEIPLLINEIYSGYKFYIRQHFFNSFDSVLYCIPK